MINVENHITKEIMVWHKSDIIELIKDFYLENQLGKVIYYHSNYSIPDYYDIKNIISIKYFSENTYIIKVFIHDVPEYTYILDMISRMRELKINKILL